MKLHTSRAFGRTAIAGCAAVGIAVAGMPVAASANESASTPKNIIVLISDGAGYNQFDIASLFDAGQSKNQVTVNPATGAITHADSTDTQVYESWPVQVGQSHYAANGRGTYLPDEAWADFNWVYDGATDSAAAATALGTGVKTNNGMLGITPASDQLLTVGEQALAVDKKVGLVTDVPFNHATPAGFIAHNADRNDYHGLATEMIDSGVDVLIGGGHPNYTSANTTRPSYFGPGSWISEADFTRVTNGETDFSYIDSRSQFEQIAAGENVPEKLFGLARVADTFQYSRPGLENTDVLPYTDPANTDVPSLATATDAALNVLEQGEEGFFLMVEAGAVDWAGHANQTTRIIEEQQAFNAAVESVNAWVEAESSWDETLVIVTADHETGYLAGAGANASDGWTPMVGTAGELPTVTWHSGNHTNALVPLYANGAGSEALNARADMWDPVRGAYLDNTDVGETVFDLLGHNFTETPDAVGIEATVGQASASGALSLAVEPGTTALTGDGATLTGTLPQVTVNDTRNELQAQGGGWTLAGSATDFVAGNRSFGADALSWAPSIVSSDNGASAGGAATLADTATLADSDRNTRVGSTVVGAELTLDVPTDAASGRYGTQITLSLFPKD